LGPTGNARIAPKTCCRTPATEKTPGYAPLVRGGSLAEMGRVAILKKSDKLGAGQETTERRGAMKRSSAIRLGVLLLALGLIIFGREWVWNTAYYLWIHFYWFISKLWHF